MRYINLGTVPAEDSQAVYHALADLMTSDQPITLVTVSPESPYVCVGYHQVAHREVDRPYCDAHDIPVGRRMVGGGAVWLDHDQIFWHLILPRQHASVDALYRKFVAAPVNAYRKMGIAALHRPVNDIVVGPRKIGGTGASTIGDADLLVGSIMMDFDTQAMARVLNVPSEKFRDKMVSSLTDYMTTVKRELGDGAPSRDEATQLLVEAFRDLLEEPVIPMRLTLAEQERLAYYRHRLFDPAFVYRNEGYLVPGVKIKGDVRLFEGMHKAPGGLVRVIWRESQGLIDDITVGGDFFVTPRDGLQRLEQALKGKPVDLKGLTVAVRGVWTGLDAPGVTVDDILAAFAAGQALSVVGAPE